MSNEHIVTLQDAREKASVISGLNKASTETINKDIVDESGGKENNDDDAATATTTTIISANISPKTILMRLGAFGIFAIIFTFTVALKDKIGIAKLFMICSIKVLTNKPNSENNDNDNNGFLWKTSLLRSKVGRLLGRSESRPKGFA